MDQASRASVEDREQAAYAEQAQQLLRRMAGHFDGVGEEFVDSFYWRLAQAEPAGSILRVLGEPGMRSLKHQQAAHLRFLVAPDTTREQLLQRAEMVGRIHALVGAGSAMLVRGHSLYRTLLAAVTAGSDLDSDQRYALSRIVEQRLQDDVQRQTEAAERVQASYWSILSRPYAATGAPWPDASAEELEALGALPGIRAALLLRLRQDGVLTVERSAGGHARDIAEVMQGPHTSVLIDPDSPRGQGLVALAWRSLLPQSTASYANDPRLAFWAEHARRLGVQSSFALPVLDAEGHAVACVYLYGAYPNQFEADWMREFGRGLQRRWEQTWQRCRAGNAYALPQELAETYRKRMFGGGLEMYLQPVVDLRSGQVHSLEALARLRMPDGSIIGPSQFLPLLGNTELDQLFRLGLRQVLAWLARQPAQRSHLTASLNLAPSTLLNPDCLDWVAQGLDAHGLPARRLQIELLETQELHSPAQRQNIDRLARLGVRLAMDDLGSGYSSLERLSRLPFDVIKIDQGLLANLRTHPVRVLSLVGSLIQMAHDLHREAVVEGLEDADAVEAVGLLGAAYGQGFGLCTPLPLPAIDGWLDGHRAAPPAAGVRSALGALAYHWRYMRGRGAPTLHEQLATCPLTGFLHEAAPHDPEAARRHAQLHAGDDVDTAAHWLREWLVRRITQG